MGQIWIVNQKLQELEWLDAWHSEPKLESFINTSHSMKFALGVGLPGRIFESKAPAWSSDVDTDVNFPRKAAAEKAGLHSGDGFPIMVDEKVYAVVELFGY